MDRLVGGALFSVFFLSASLGFAQDSDQSSSDSGVLVSSPVNAPISDQHSADNNGNSGAAGLSDRGDPNSSGHHKDKQADNDSDASSPNTTGDNSNGSDASKPVDDIVVKATDAVVFQMTANLKLTQDQITAVRPIIADNIAKVRDLQQSLEDGHIDSKTMYNQRQQLINEEYQELGSVLAGDQLKLWISIQNDQ